MKFDCFHDYAEQTAMGQALAVAYPKLTKLEPIGKSYCSMANKVPVRAKPDCT